MVSGGSLDRFLNFDSDPPVKESRLVRNSVEIKYFLMNCLYTKGSGLGKSVRSSGMSGEWISHGEVVGGKGDSSARREELSEL